MKLNFFFILLILTNLLKLSLEKEKSKFQKSLRKEFKNRILNEQKCYLTCETCTKKGNSKENFCTTCKNKYIKSIMNKNNCECPKFYISPKKIIMSGESLLNNKTRLLSLTDSFTCLNKCNFYYPFIYRGIFDKGECFGDCKNKNEFYYINQCYSNCPNGTYKTKMNCNEFWNDIFKNFPIENEEVINYNEFYNYKKLKESFIDKRKRKAEEVENEKEEYEENNECLVNICEDTYKCARNNFVTEYSLEVIKQNFKSVVNSYYNEYVKNSNHIKVIKSIKDDFVIVLYKNEDCFQKIGDDLIKLKLKSFIKETYSIKDDKLEHFFISLIYLFNSKKQIQKIELLLYDENFNKLNDEYFKKDSKIKISLKIDKNVNITEELISMISEDNNECKYNDYINKKDIALNERFNIIKKTNSLCYEGCLIDKINGDKVDCYCKIEESSIKTTKKEYFIKELNKIFSFNVLKCSKYAFNLDSILSYNSFIFIIIPIIQLFISIIYFKYGMKQILNFISSVVSNPPKKEKEEEENVNKNNEKIETKENNNEISEKNEIDNSEIIKDSSKKSSTTSITKIYLPSNNSIDTSFDESKRTISKNYFTKNTDTSRSNFSQYPLQNNSLNLKKVKKNKNNYYFESIKNDENILYNKMKYLNAIKYDKRSFLKFYFNQIKERQSIYYTFIYKNTPLDQISIKIMVFISEFSLCFLSNAILTNEKYIYINYYIKNKNIDFFLKNGWLRIFISVIIIILFDFFFNLLSIPKKKMIILIKTKSDKKKLYEKLLEKYNLLKYCNLIFIILNLVLMIFLFIFLITFNYVYNYSYIDLLLGSIITWLFIQILPLLGVLIISILRFVSIKIKCKLLYEISQFFTT